LARFDLSPDTAGMMINFLKSGCYFVDLMDNTWNRDGYLADLNP